MDSTLFASVLETRNYIVGAANAPSGLFRRRADAWEHLGWTNVRAFGIAVDPFDASRIVVAGGNGVLVSPDHGASWRVTTDWRVTEVLAVAFDPHTRGRLLAATGYGLWATSDGAKTWSALRTAGRPNETFSACIVPDRTQRDRWILGTEAGLVLTEDGGKSWTDSLLDAPIRKIVQSPGDDLEWFAATEGEGIFQSTDGGQTWTQILEGGTFYALAVNPRDTRVVLAGGYETGLLVSVNCGHGWRRRELDAPTQSVYSLAFDGSSPLRLWIGLVNEGVVSTTDLGLTTADAGLPEATVTGLVYLPAA